MVDLDIAVKPSRSPSCNHSPLGAKPSENRGDETNTIKAPSVRQEDSPLLRNDGNGGEFLTTGSGIPLEDFLLTRLPNVSRHLSGHTDDSPSSVLVNLSLNSKKKRKDSLLAHQTFLSEELYPSWTVNPSNNTLDNNENADAGICGDPYLQQTSRFEDYNKTRDQVNDDRVLLHLNSSVDSSFFKTLNEEIRSENEDDSSNSSDSSAALESFLNNRLRNLLDETIVPVPDDLTNNNDGDGSSDHPVDLTQQFTDNLHPDTDDHQLAHTTPDSRPIKKTATQPLPESQMLVPPSKVQNLTPQRNQYRYATNSRRHSADSKRKNGAMNSQQQRRPSASLFNPILTGFSPQKQSTSSFIGDIFSYMPGSEILMLEEDKKEEEYDDDKSSVDSEAFLEMKASKIRTELRHEAMVEIALEAERAADAGEERFQFSRPWTYGKEDHRAMETSLRLKDSYSPVIQSYQVLRRNASYTEGVTPIVRRHVSSMAVPRSALLPVRRRRPDKVKFHDLRDVHEVFPSFDLFHKNLRTHLARNNVNQECLVFEEFDHNQVTMTEMLLDRMNTASTANFSSIVSVGSELPTSSFLDSFSFDLLGGANGVVAIMNSSTEQQGEDGFGDFLAEHIHSDSATRRPPKREILPGLEDHVPEFAQPTSRHRSRTKNTLFSHRQGLANKREVLTTSIQKVRMQLKEDEALCPRALFDQDDEQNSDGESLVEQCDSSIMSNSPLVSTHLGLTNSTINQQGDFVTPARLRIMRSKDGERREEGLSSLAPDKEATLHSHHTSSPSTTLLQRDCKTPPALLIPVLPAVGSFDNYTAEVAGSVVANLIPTVVPKLSNLGAQVLQAHAEYEGLPPTGQRRSRSRPWENRLLFDWKLGEANEVHGELVPVWKEIDLQVANVIKPTSSMELHEVDPWANDNELFAPTLHDCSCLSLSQSSSLEDCAISDSLNELSYIIPSERSSSPAPFAVAMKMLSNLSPTCKKRIGRSLYVGLQENDDFMQNYLYCGKSGPSVSAASAGVTRDRKICSEPCHDSGCEDGVLSVAQTCYAALVLNYSDAESCRETVCGPADGAGLSGRRDSLFLRHKAAPRPTWFCAASQRVDGVIGSLVGKTRQSRWNLSFNPPSLRKVESTGWMSRTSLDVTIEEKSLDGSPSPSISSLHTTKAGVMHQSPGSSSPEVALFPTRDDDPTVQLVYDLPRGNAKYRNLRPVRSLDLHDGFQRPLSQGLVRLAGNKPANETVLMLELNKSY